MGWMGKSVRDRRVEFVWATRLNRQKLKRQPQVLSTRASRVAQDDTIWGVLWDLVDLVSSPW